MLCFFVSDLHGRKDRYLTLLKQVEAELPKLLFLGGDLLPMTLDLSWASKPDHGDFLTDFLFPELRDLKSCLGEKSPRVILILGNDDPRFHEESLHQAESEGLLEHIHNRCISAEDWSVYGYACVPPTPFQLKDWERYDVSRYVDPGCVSPEEGRRTVAVDTAELRYGSIEKDLAELAGDAQLDRSIFLFHSPPYKTKLDRAALDGQSVDHVPKDVHIGSIAIERFIRKRQPALTLHGHVHESTRLTGSWQDKIGKTLCLQAAHEGPELSLIRFNLETPAAATRELIATKV
jgi:uncharacterized protein